MRERFKNWFSTTSSWSKVFLFVVPLILVTGFASLLFQKGSNLVLLYTLPPSPPPPSYANLDSVKNSSLPAKERDIPVDLHSEIASSGSSSSKEASSNEAALINSVSPVPQSLQVQQLVRSFPLFHGHVHTSILCLLWLSNFSLFFLKLRNLNHD